MFGRNQFHLCFKEENFHEDSKDYMEVGDKRVYVACGGNKCVWMCPSRWGIGALVVLESSGARNEG